MSDIPSIPIQQQKRIGLLAGAGRFPIAFAEAARREGHYVYCLGIQGLAANELGEICNKFSTAPLARIGKAIRKFKSNNIRHVVMAGKIEKRILFHPLRWIRLTPDWRTIHMWFRYARENKKDDTLLLAVIREFERDNITFESALGHTTFNQIVLLIIVP